jgi:hypothetical protein
MGRSERSRREPQRLGIEQRLVINRALVNAITEAVSEAELDGAQVDEFLASPSEVPGPRCWEKVPPDGP